MCFQNLFSDMSADKSEDASADALGTIILAYLRMLDATVYFLSGVIRPCNNLNGPFSAIILCVDNGLTLHRANLCFMK